LVGDLMTFAALQEMNIPGPDLKVFRVRVEPKLEKADELELSDLFSIGSFFWDLTRTGLRHKGYRMQSSKAGKAFVSKLKTFNKDDITPVQIDAFSWGAIHKFWPSGNDPLPSPEFLRRALKEPRLAAAILGWILGPSWFPRHRITDYAPLMIMAKEAARTEKDAFYRYQFDKVSDGFNAMFQELKAEEERRKSYGSKYDDDNERRRYDLCPFGPQRARCTAASAVVPLAKCNTALRRSPNRNLITIESGSVAPIEKRRRRPPYHTDCQPQFLNWIRH